MSRRSMIRAHLRNGERRRRRAALRATVGITATLGAGAVLVAPADAAPLMVTNKNDTGAGSLRQAILDANASSDADVITFGPTVTGNMAVNSEFSITNPVDIQGPGSGKLSLIASGGHRFFDIAGVPAPDQPVRIAGLTMTDGNALYGGAITNAVGTGNSAELTIDDCVITGNVATNKGGGVYSTKGSLTIRDSTISANSSKIGGGVIVYKTDGDQATEVTVTGSTITGNESSTTDGGGIDLDQLLGDTLIRNSTISGNSAHFDGAGIALYRGTGAALTIDSSTIANNSGHYHGGGLSLFVPSGPVLISNSTVTGNSAREGGGIDVTDDDKVPMDITNSTIAGNEATYAGGGIFFYADVAGSELDLNSTIVAGNLSPLGPDIRQKDPTFGTLGAGFSLFGTDPTADSNLVATPAGSNLLAVDPELGGLAANGGPTRTMIPAADSPAIDAGSAAGLTLDARGLPRTVDQPVANASDGTDIGAVERPDTEFTGAEVSAAGLQHQRGKKIEIALEVGAGENATASSTGSVTAGKSSFSLATASSAIVKEEPQNVTLMPDSQAATKKIVKRLNSGKEAQASVSVTLTDSAGNSDTQQLAIDLKGKKKKHSRHHGH